MDIDKILEPGNRDEIDVEKIEKYFKDKGLDLEAGIARIKATVEKLKKQIEEEDKKKEEEKKSQEIIDKTTIKKIDL